MVTHREVMIDPNNGTRARLPLCNPNPNRVKEKGKGPGVVDVTGIPVTTATARGKRCRTAVLTGARQEKNRSVFGSEKKGKGSQEP